MSGYNVTTNSKRPATAAAQITANPTKDIKITSVYIGHPIIEGLTL
jgi:hypothetical protein